MSDTLQVADLVNGKLDVETIAEVAMVGTTEDTTTNREGVEIDTLEGRLKKVGFEPPLAYAAGIEFLTPADAVKSFDQGGIIYGCLASSRPFTTTGNFSADEPNFFVIQDNNGISGNVRNDSSNTYAPGTTQNLSSIDVNDKVGVWYYTSIESSEVILPQDGNYQTNIPAVLNESYEIELYIMCRANVAGGDATLVCANVFDKVVSNAVIYGENYNNTTSLGGTPQNVNVQSGAGARAAGCGISPENGSEFVIKAYLAGEFDFESSSIYSLQWRSAAGTLSILKAYYRHRKIPSSRIVID